MDLTNIKTIKELLSAHETATKKMLGQNFLINQKALEAICNAAQLNESDHVIEVGPGIGVLTKELAQKSQKVTSIELDSSLLPILEKTLSDYTNIEIIHADALRWDMPTTGKYKVVANIPYNITSPLINHFLRSPNPPESVSLLIQKEVAEKICKLDPKMSFLSLSVALYGVANILNNSFWTFLSSSKVDSAIIHIKLNQKIDFDKNEEVLKIAKQAFRSQRKKLSNTIPHLKAKLEQLGFTDLRPQHLSLEMWEKLVS